MIKYCLLQLKRAARFLPWGLCVVLVLFTCMSLAYNAITSSQNDESDSMKLKIGVVGSSQDKYLQWGLAAMKFDSTSMSMELNAMEEDEARRALEQGKISVYVVFPENFIADAMSGNPGQLQLVTTMGATGLTPILKEEVTHLVESILASCENGAYGAGSAVLNHGNPSSANHHVDELALEYVDFLLVRSRMYRIEEMEQTGIAFEDYMLGGLSLLLMMLCCLPFAPLYIRSDHSLSRVLRAKRIGTIKQTLSEFGAYLSIMIVMLAVIACVLKQGNLLSSQVSGFQMYFRALPVLFMVAALCFCIYTLSDNLISGVLLAFFLVIVLCFTGGCMYPIQVFPAAMQTIATILPTGIARVSLTNSLMGLTSTGIFELLAYGVAFLAIALVARAYKTGKVRG